MLIRWLYTCLLTLGSPFLLYGLYNPKKGKPSIGPRWREHFGATPSLTSSTQPLWIHAVSVGEVLAVTPLIQRLKQLKPELDIVITTTTTTGAQQAQKLSNLTTHRYMPLDFPFAVSGFVKAIQPSQLLIMETELWPNTLHTVARHGIPVSVINARLSERSYHRYTKILPIFNLLTKNLHKVLCQYPDDADRFIRLGLKKAQVKVTGSIKFDIDISSSVLSNGSLLRSKLGENRPIWIAASTHISEDEQVLHAHKLLLQTHPQALLILVPRHPERFNSVCQTCIKSGFNTIRRTDESYKNLNDTQVYLADTMGEMLTLIQSAEICFMGGSLAGEKVGGHNMLEPAALGKPVLTGPSYYNFSDIVQRMLENEAIVIVDSSEKLHTQLLRFFEQPELILRIGDRGRQCVHENQGAIESTIEEII